MKRFRGLLVAFAVVSTLAMPAAPAYAIDTYAERQCSSGGFTGYIRVHYSYTPGSGSITVRYYSYRINPGTNDRRRQGSDIYVSDSGIIPTRYYSSGYYATTMDNSYHVLVDPPNYSRSSSGWFGFRFVFDKAWSPDPECSGYFRVPSTY